MNEKAASDPYYFAMIAEDIVWWFQRYDPENKLGYDLQFWIQKVYEDEEKNQMAKKKLINEMKLKEKYENCEL